MSASPKRARSRRLVVMSNRVGPVRGAARAGGLAVALVEALRESGGLWCGWSGRVANAVSDRLNLGEADGIRLATLDLSVAEHEDYYNGFCNRCLWPLFHFRIGLTAFERHYYEAYRRVNARFAHAFAPLLRADDLVWVHDYHLIHCGQELRAQGCRQALGFYLHIPFPSREVLLTLPNNDQLVQALFAYDVLGFQTARDVERFLDHVANECGAQVSGDRVTAYGRSVRVGAFPVGIDAAGFERLAHGGEGLRQWRRLREQLAGRQLIVGVDRLDYTKGLAERFQSYALLLETHPEARGRIEYMQIAPPSRGEVPEYAAIRAELEGLAGRINGRYAELDWIPLHYINRAYSRSALAGIYRASHIGLVTPLRDGMNLVAKEYVAAQDPADPGVLVLSRFAGAAWQMKAALIVNPYDQVAVAEALQTARYLPLEERRNRHAELLRGLREYDLARWREDFLAALREVPAARAAA
ncbi:MAG: trehalose-6-phosphate synthase [Sinobacteraceae bacterium]|nr:trehalose-6-phosphate synthase [Nevskiaceae bacterium]